MHINKVNGKYTRWTPKKTKHCTKLKQTKYCIGS